MCSKNILFFCNPLPTTKLNAKTLDPGHKYG
jgi:hypothetical protein